MNPSADHYAFISLGSNLPSTKGNSLETIKFAITRLKALSSSPLLVSSFYVSVPQQCPPGSNDYVNAVVGLIPQIIETPYSLLKQMQLIEQEAERKRTGIQNEERTLDLDIITFKNCINKDAALILPHPRAKERRFVLEPLVEIIGDWVLPGEKSSLKSMLNLNKDQGLRILNED